MAKISKYAKASPCVQAVIFARVSTKEQEPGASLDAQTVAMENYCRRINLPIVKSYKVTESSTNGKRKQFKEMLDFTKRQKRKTAIVVHCIDRFQRRFTECSEVNDLLLSDKTDLHFCKEELILTRNSPSSDIMRWDMGILSGKLYVSNLRDNVNRAMMYNWSLGKYQSKAPIGYLNVNKNIIIDPNRGPTVKKMFELYASGLYTLDGLQKFAQDQNLFSSHSKTKKPLGRETIYAMLRNPFYYGEMVIRGEKMPHIHGALISKDLFDQVQDKLSGGKIHTKTQEYAGIPFAFRGLIKCANCGCTITSETHTKKSGRIYRYLRCTHSKGNCNQGLVSEITLLKQLDDEIFNKIKLKPEILQLLKKCVQKRLLEESEANAVMKRKITQDLNKLEAKEQRVKDSFFEGDITREEWQEEKANIAAKKQKLQNTAATYADISKDIQHTVDELLDLATCVSQIMKQANPLQQNKLLRLMFAECKLDGQKLIYKLQKPFDKLVNFKNANTWFDFDKNDIAEYENMSEKLEIYKIETENTDEEKNSLTL